MTEILSINDQHFIFANILYWQASKENPQHTEIHLINGEVVLVQEDAQEILNVMTALKDKVTNPKHITIPKLKV